MSSRSYSLNSNYDNGHGKQVSKLLDDAVKSTAVASSLSSSLIIPAEASSVQKLGEDSSGHLFIRAFLANTKRKLRGWALDPKTIHQRVLSILGKPLVIDRDPVTGLIDHPKYDVKQSAEANALQQSKYKIGEIVKVLYNAPTNSYYCDAKITDPKAKEFFSSYNGKEVPLAVSPQIVWNPNDGVNKQDMYSNYEFVHLSAVSSAAYGPDARVIGTCSGKAEECHKKLPQQVAPLVAVASASSCTSDSDSHSTDPDSAYPYFPAPTRYHAILNNIVDDAVAVARSLGMGIAIASSESDTSESADASTTHRLRRVYQVPKNYSDKLQAPSNGKPSRKLA